MAGTPYARTWREGKQFNERTNNMLAEVERRVGNLTYYQGSYSSSVGASAGTHDGGGAVDLWPAAGQNVDDVVRAMRNVGFAAWYRPAIPGVWTSHIHGIAIGDKQLAPLARSQVTDYYNHRNGLASHSYDPFYHPSPIRVWGKNVGPGTPKRAAVDASKLLNQFRFKARNKAAIPGTRLVQKALNREGIRVRIDGSPQHLAVDGRLGPQTQAAFRKYRERHNLGPIKAIQRLLKRPVKK